MQDSKTGLVLLLHNTYFKYSSYYKILLFLDITEFLPICVTYLLCFLTVMSNNKSF